MQRALQTEKKKVLLTSLLDIFVSTVVVAEVAFGGGRWVFEMSEVGVEWFT